MIYGLTLTRGHLHPIVLTRWKIRTFVGSVNNVRCLARFAWRPDIRFGVLGAVPYQGMSFTIILR